MVYTSLLDSATEIDSTQADITLSSDYELNGQINRASAQGAKFALLLAMLEQDSINRPRLEKTDQLYHIKDSQNAVNHYRSSSLSADQEYWQSSQYTGKLIQQGHLDSAHLWLAMHPEPLALHNDPFEIDEEIIANASVFAQTRMQKDLNPEIKLDETGLFDILNELEAS